MTECGPLVTHSTYNVRKLYSCGSIVDRMQVKILSEDPETIPGEVWVKGDNLMLGYYKNKDATAEIFDKEGWMNTGDMGILDSENYLFLKGRSKNMILGPSGQNIYPEEIEAKLNNMPMMLESVVTDDKNSKLVALVYPDYESIDSSAKINEAKILEVFEKNRILINKELPAYMRISRVQLYPEEFKKTPKRNIKRYLYTNILK
jgi:long-chain acyl-CoA synthetase